MELTLLKLQVEMVLEKFPEDLCNMLAVFGHVPAINEDVIDADND